MLMLNLINASRTLSGTLIGVGLSRLDSADLTDKLIAVVLIILGIILNIWGKNGIYNGTSNQKQNRHREI